MSPVTIENAAIKVVAFAQYGVCTTCDSVLTCSTTGIIRCARHGKRDIGVSVVKVLYIVVPISVAVINVYMFIGCRSK